MKAGSVLINAVQRFLIKQIALFLSLVSFTAFGGYAQVGIGTSKPDSSAALHIYDTAKGLLIPRVTTRQRNAVHKPAEGLMVYQTDSVKGFWYFSDGRWKNMTPANNGGKETIILSGDITDSGAAVKIAAEYGPNTQSIRIAWCTSLTTVDLSMVTNIADITIYSNPLLKTVNLSGLQSIESSLSIRYCAALTNLVLSSLKKIYQGSVEPNSPGLGISNCGLKNLSFPVLNAVVGALDVSANDSLATVSFPSLVTQGGVAFTGNAAISISNNNKLTTILLPVLSKAVALIIGSNQKLVTVSAPSLASAQAVSIIYCKMSELTLPSLASAESLVVSNDSSLTKASFPALSTVGSLNIDNNPKLPGVSFPALNGASVIELLYNTAMTSALLPALKTAGNITIQYAGNGFTSFSLPVATTIQTLLINNDPGLVSVALPALDSIGNLTVSGFSLTNFSTPVLTGAGNIILDNNPKLPNISMPALKNALSIELISNGVMTAALFPVLKTAGTITLQNAADDFSSFNLPQATAITSLVINNIIGITSVSLPVLSTIGSLSLSSSKLINFAAPALTTAASLTIASSDSLASLSFPSLKSLTNVSATSSFNSPALKSINIDNLSSFKNQVFSVRGLLPSSQINYLLNKFVSITPPLINRTFSLRQIVPAPPTGQGLIDRSTLRTNPNTVNTD